MKAVICWNLAQIHKPGREQPRPTMEWTSERPGNVDWQVSTARAKHWVVNMATFP